MSNLEILLASLVIVLAIGVLYMVLKFQRLKADGKLHYDKAPIGLIRQHMDGGSIHISSPAKDITKVNTLSTLDELGKLFSDKHRETYNDSLSALRNLGEGFSITIDGLEQKRNFHLEGDRVGDFFEIWIEDTSLLAWLGQLSSDRENELLAMQALFDQLPLPIWWRQNEGLKLLGCNKYYTELVGEDWKTILSEQIELGRGVIAEHGKKLAQRAVKSSSPQTESHYIVTAGKRRLFDFSECSYVEGSKYVLGYAIDVTHMEESQSTLATHVAAHDQVLGKMGSAISIYGPDKRLKFFNDAYLKMWSLTDDVLHEDMLYGDVLELLRARRQLPEIIDFPAYKRARESRFNSLIEAEEELQHIPDERTIRMVVSPHPFGGLMHTFEDVTDRLALERSYNTLIAVQQETLNNLYEGVAVFGSDGRIGVWNKVYSDLWKIPEKILRHGPHVSELVDLSKEQFAGGKSWKGRRERLILSVIEPKPRQRRIERLDGVVIDIAHVPLPDGQCLVLYQDVTTAAKVEKALAERNIAFEKADMLKSQFVANVSYELRTPLNAIQGFSEILHSQHFGPLNERQSSQVESILSASNMLLRLINDVLDLASLQAGFMRIDATEGSFPDLLQEVTQGLMPRIEERKLIFNLSCDEDVGNFVCDQMRMAQVVRNITENALKFAQRGESLNIHAFMFEGSLKVQFIASGYVSAEEDRELLVKRFEGRDAHALRTGVGLGFALAKSLIDLHGGTLDLNVGAEGGAEISFSLPVSDKPSQRVRLALPASKD